MSSGQPGLQREFYNNQCYTENPVGGRGGRGKRERERTLLNITTPGTVGVLPLGQRMSGFKSVVSVLSITCYCP